MRIRFHRNFRRGDGTARLRALRASVWWRGRWFTVCASGAKRAKRSDCAYTSGQTMHTSKGKACICFGSSCPKNTGHTPHTATRRPSPMILSNSSTTQPRGPYEPKAATVWPHFTTQYSNTVIAAWRSACQTTELSFQIETIVIVCICRVLQLIDFDVIIRSYVYRIACFDHLLTILRSHHIVRNLDMLQMKYEFSKKKTYI